MLRFIVGEVYSDKEKQLIVGEAKRLVADINKLNEVAKTDDEKDEEQKDDDDNKTDQIFKSL